MSTVQRGIRNTVSALSVSYIIGTIISAACGFWTEPAWEFVVSPQK